MSKIKRADYLWWGLLGFIVFLAGVLRMWQLDRLNLWSDEIFTVFQAQLSVGGVIDIAIKDTALPLYPLLLHVWIQLFGSGAVAVRLLSALIDMAGLGVFYFLGRKFVGRWASLALMGLYAVNFIAIYYAREARTYGLLMLIASASALATLNFRSATTAKNKMVWGGLLALSLALGIYAHNLAVFVIASVFLYLGMDWLGSYKSALDETKKHLGLAQRLLLWTVNRELLERTKQLVYLGLGTLILILPALYSVLLQSKTVQSGGFWLKFDPISTTALTVTDLASGMHLVTWNTPNPLDILGIFLTLLFLFIASARVLTDPKIKLQESLPALFFWISFLGMFLLSFKSPVMYVRYASFLIPFVILLSYQGIQALRGGRGWKSVLVGIMLVLQLQIYLTHYLPDYGSKARYSDAVSYIRANNRGETAVLLSDMSPFYGFKYYGDPGWIVKIYDPQRETPYYFGTSQTSESDYSREPNGFENRQSFWWVKQSKKITPEFLGRDYQLQKEQSFPGDLEVQLWAKKES